VIKVAKKEEKKVVLERTYNVPLRKEFQKAPKYRRAKKAGIAVKEFLQRHMKSDDIKVGRHLNMKVWENGIKNPPHHVQVLAIKYNDESVFVELVGATEDKKAEKKSAKSDAKAPKKEKKAEAKKETSKAEAKPKAAAKDAPKKAPVKEAKSMAEEKPKATAKTDASDKKEAPKKAKE
jgi:large subunit ribosomal protein L31e